MFRLAVAQTPAELDTPEARLGWLRNTLPALSKRNTDLVLLPELFACGYNIGDAVHNRAEAADGPIFDAMAAMAKEFGVAIHYGFAERAGDRLYNAAACVSSQGALLTHQRKLVIPPGAERRYFQQGQGCKLFDFKGLKIATLICYDAEFPETARNVASLGAELILVPTALGAEWSWVAERMIPTRAYENGVYLAYANSAGIEHGMEFLGKSVIAAPDGVELARATDAPEILFATVEKTRVKQAQNRLPYLRDRSTLRF
jgi:predicted amidohydrolase